MSTSAWVMMLSTWAVIVFFATRFFLLVLRAPAKSDEVDS